MSDAALRASLCLPCSCFSDTFLPALSPLWRFPRPSARRFPLCEDSLAGRPAFPVSEATPACASALRPRTIPCAPRFAFHVHAFQTRSFRCFPFCGDCPVGSSGSPPLGRFSRRSPGFSRVGGYTGLRFCIAPPDNTLRAPLYLPCSCFSDTFLPVLSPLRRFPRRSIRRFPFCGDCPVGSSGASPFVKIPSSAAPLFPVSEATPACASALRPWTIPCAPRFAFHVHTSQANSLPSDRPA